MTEPVVGGVWGKTDSTVHDVYRAGVQDNLKNLVLTRRLNNPQERTLSSI